MYFTLYLKKIAATIAVFVGVRYGNMPVMLIHQGFCCVVSDQEPL